MKNEMVSPKEIGKRLRELRGIRTRTGVANEIGILPSRLGNYELGYASVPDDIKVLLANYYGQSVESLFYTNEYKET